MVAAPITLLMPGAGPPPTRIASFFRCVTAILRSALHVRICLIGRKPGRACMRPPTDGRSGPITVSAERRGAAGYLLQYRGDWNPFTPDEGIDAGDRLVAFERRHG